jgi:hypothetical protein
MTTNTPLVATLAVLALASCATREPMPFPTATNCFYPACVIDVDVVEEGGVRKLKMTNDGNVRMGTRQRLTAIVWNIRTPGYEFRGTTIQPPSATTPSGLPMPTGGWDSQIINHNWSFYSVSVTDLNTEPVVLAYQITVYPDRVVGGDPVTALRGIVNDPGPHPQRRQ